MAQFYSVRDSTWPQFQKCVVLRRSQTSEDLKGNFELRMNCDESC
jgi:hypothetical protein